MTGSPRRLARHDTTSPDAKTMAEIIPPHALAAMRDCMQVIDKVAQGDSSLRLNVMLGLAAALIREVMTCQNGELADVAVSTINELWHGDVPFEVVPVRRSGEVAH